MLPASYGLSELTFDYILLMFFNSYYTCIGAWDRVVIKALRYYSDGPGIDSPWCHWIFHWHISFRTMVLGSTQPLVKMSTKNIPHGKDGRCVRLTTLPPSRAECHEIWESEPPGTFWATPGLLRDTFTFTLYMSSFRVYLKTLYEAELNQVTCR